MRSSSLSRSCACRFWSSGLASGSALLRHLAHEALGRLAQLIHQLADFLVAGAALERLAQGLLGGAQVALGLRGVAVFDLLRHRPEQGGDVDEVGVAAGVLKRDVGLLQAEIDVGGRVEQFRRDRKAGQRRLDAFWRVVGVENEVAALFDQRARQGIVERPLRQRHLDRPALAGLARNAGRAQRHRHLGARPGVLGEVDGRARVADAVGGRRQLEGRLRRRRQRALGRAGPLLRTGEVRPGAGQPKPIVDAVGERQRPADIGARVLGRRDRRNAGGRDGKDDDGRGGAVAQDRRLAGAVDRPPPFGRRASRRLALLLGRTDRPFDARFDEARVAAHDQDRILGNIERLRIRGLEVDDDRRPAGVGRRVDPSVDAARRRGGDSLVAAPVEGGGETAVHFRSRRDRRGEGEERHAEAERIGVALGHARGGRGDADRFDRALKTRAMRGPKGVRARVAVVVGEAVGERGGGTVVRSRVAVEPRQNVARRGAAQTRERRKGDEPREREQDDAGDAEGPRRELPGAQPRGGKKQDDDRDRNDERRPCALDHQRAPRQSR